MKKKSQKYKDPGDIRPKGVMTATKTISTDNSFLYIIKKEAKKISVPIKENSIEPLACLDYSKELEIKNRSLAIYLKQNGISVPADKLIQSPKPRYYRTTSRRRIIVKHGKTYLCFTNILNNSDADGPETSILEPTDHESIYTSLYHELNSSMYSILGKCLNYIIIRGSYQEYIIIFNFHTLNGPVIRKVRSIVDSIKKVCDKIIGTFVYFDPSRSKYYLEIERPESSFQVKKISGYDNFQLKIDSKKYFVPPLSFSQINESCLPLMIYTIKNMLNNHTRKRLIDIYCGYGLFSHYFNDLYKEIIGIDACRSSIKAAQLNSKFNPSAKTNTFFRSFFIKNGNCNTILPVPGPLIKEDIILDPPYNGVDKKTIQAIALRNPEKVIHIFCNIEQIPIALNQWKNYGYTAKKIMPIDMFAGTPQIEVIVLLEK